MYKVSKFQSVKNPQVTQIIAIDEVLHLIKHGDDNQKLIQTAREYGKGSPLYNNIKTELLPSFRFNFLFKDSANNKNIVGPTGLIYLDLDNVDSIPNNDYIFASWKSLSNTGFGILVKVDNLTLDNYSEIYNELTKIIGIDSDTGARKATQQTVLSYDSNLFYNPNSLVFNYSNSKKVPNLPILEKREKGIGTNDTFLGITSVSIRFNNIEDYFQNEYENEIYRVFVEKIRICNPFIPNKIPEGKRNSTLFFLLSQYALLNPNIGKPFLKSISETLNKKMFPSLSEKEIDTIINKIIQKREEGSLQLFLNEERLILFNPSIQITIKEKMQLVNEIMGKRKVQLTKEIIYLALENWNFDQNGKITQKKVVQLTGKCITTIKRYWKEFKHFVKELNNNYNKNPNF